MKPTHKLKESIFWLPEYQEGVLTIIESDLTLYMAAGTGLIQEGGYFKSENGSVVPLDGKVVPVGEVQFDDKIITIEVQSDWYSIEQCNANPNKLYIFGDNASRFGKRGQAQIRDCQNSYGIATKMHPSNDTASYFSDSVKNTVMLSDIDNLVRSISSSGFTTIVFPKDGLGTGLSELPTRAPKMFAKLLEVLEKHFSLGSDKELKLYNK